MATNEIYIAKQGDTWDRIAFMKWGEETMMHHLLDANPDLCNIVIFEGGEQVKIPIMEEPLNTASLPPWRQ